MEMRFEVPSAELDPIRVELCARGIAASAGEPTLDGDGVLVVADPGDAAEVRSAVAELASRSREQ